ncbi:hypothetical protein [Nostoc sp. MS1]|uniref:hypothetical protein n=1 Tax=Nostoc sp. MS1 TaxID=2764711 RepID=UPI001CC7217F|nr:hypothetical protein [Nostoc sp. MS1]
MLLTAFITLGLAIFFVAISLKMTNQLWQVVLLLVGFFWLCCSLKFSFIPIEVILVIALLMTRKLTGKYSS